VNSVDELVIHPSQGDSVGRSDVFEEVRTRMTWVDEDEVVLTHDSPSSRMTGRSDVTSITPQSPSTWKTEPFQKSASMPP